MRSSKRNFKRRLTTWPSGFTLIEVMVSMTLLVFLAVGVLSAIGTMHNIARRQASYNSVLALVMSEQERLRAESYLPPNEPFTAEKTTLTSAKSVSFNPDGTAYLIDVTLSTDIEPVSNGHKVTVTGTYVFSGKTVRVSTSTVINQFTST
ncbi:MAG: type II secretion system protein [Coraliomargarita sp.]